MVVRDVGDWGALGGYSSVFNGLSAPANEQWSLVCAFGSEPS